MIVLYLMVASLALILSVGCGDDSIRKQSEPAKVVVVDAGQFPDMEAIEDSGVDIGGRPVDTEWTIEGSHWNLLGDVIVSRDGRSEDPKLALVDDNPSVAWRQGYERVMLSVLSLSSNTWQTGGFVSDPEHGVQASPSIAVSQDGQLHVAFHEGAPEARTTLVASFENDLSLIETRFNAGRYDDVTEPRLAPTETGLVMAVYIDGAVVVGARSIDGSWQQLGNPIEGATLVRDSLDITVASGVPTVAFAGWSGLNVHRFIDGFWADVFAPDVGDCREASIDSNENGELFVMCIEDGPEMTMRVLHWKPDGGWSAIPSTGLLPSVRVSHGTLRTTPAGRPALAWQSWELDGGYGNQHVHVFDGEVWQRIGEGPLDVDIKHDLHGRPDLVFSSDGHPVVAWGEIVGPENEDRVIYVKRFE